MLSHLWATRERSKSTESVPPLAMVNRKGKALETPSTILKKRKFVKALKAEPKKTKLLALATPATRAVEVYTIFS